MAAREAAGEHALSPDMLTCQDVVLVGGTKSVGLCDQCTQLTIGWKLQNMVALNLPNNMVCTERSLSAALLRRRVG